MLGTVCQLCGRKFSNRKALGGHMRSHYATLPIPHKKQIDPQDQQQQQPSDPPNDSASSVISSIEKGETSGGMVNLDFSDVGFEGEGEMGTLEKEEDAARSLVMLSKDVRVRNESTDTDYNKYGYKCEICGKVFQRPQGLGSHRVSHSRKIEKKKMNSSSSCSIVDLNHECSVCGKVFGCGKALGGHKRSHNLIAKSGGKKEGKSIVQVQDRSIDLNVAADEEYEEEFDSTGN